MLILWFQRSRYDGVMKTGVDGKEIIPVEHGVKLFQWLFCRENALLFGEVHVRKNAY